MFFFTVLVVGLLAVLVAVLLVVLLAVVLVVLLAVVLDVLLRVERVVERAEFLAVFVAGVRLMTRPRA
jgi:hypothetical protein